MGSFILLNGIILINVVVAVLLEKMVDEPAPAAEAEGEPTEAKVQRCSNELKYARQNAEIMKQQISAISKALQIPVGVASDATPSHMSVASSSIADSQRATAGSPV